MLRITTLLLLICTNARLSYGMKCSWGHENFISDVLNSCPALLDPEEKAYCCYDISNKKMYCCDAMEFALKSSWMVLAMIISFTVLFSMIIFCISCLCCSCCPWYRRRHRGTIYGKVQVPSVVHVIQSPASVPQPTPQYTNPAYPTSSAGISQPPSYSEVVYEKQAPYNPNYTSSTQQ